MTDIKNPYHNANMLRWNAAAEQWGQRADSRGIWEKCIHNPTLAFSKTTLEILGTVDQKKICVLGSGDQEVVFALAGLGAEVTSVDISINQLNIAKRKAAYLKLNINFIQSDVTNLNAIDSSYFDLVYTGGHVAVWVSDLTSYYSEAFRILKNGGSFIVDEYHPFRRIWNESKTVLSIENPYLNRGPFKYFLNDDVLDPTKGRFESYEFHWSIADFVNALLENGFVIKKLKEYGDRIADWELARFEGLPECLLLYAEKPISV